MHGRTEIWNLSSSVHIDIERLSAAYSSVFNNNFVTFLTAWFQIRNQGDFKPSIEDINLYRLSNWIIYLENAKFHFHVKKVAYHNFAAVHFNLFERSTS